MKGNRWLVALCLGWLFLIGPALAEVPLPVLKARVTDLTGTLSAGQQASIETRLAAFEQKKGSQVAVLIVPTTQPEDIAQYSVRVVAQWKLGRKGVDDGVLLLVAKDDRALRIEVGYGLEGVLNDATSKRIIEEFIVPKFKAGDLAGGINAGLDRITGLIDGEPLPAPKAANPGGSQLEQLFPVVFFVALAVGSVLRSIFGSFLGGVLNGGLVTVILLFLGLHWLFSGAAGLFAFVLTLAGISPMGGGGYGRGGGGGFGGGGFSGGGGGFGGGGASGRW